MNSLVCTKTTPNGKLGFFHSVSLLMKNSKLLYHTKRRIKTAAKKVISAKIEKGPNNNGPKFIYGIATSARVISKGNFQSVGQLVGKMKTSASFAFTCRAHRTEDVPGMC